MRQRGWHTAFCHLWARESGTRLLHEDGKRAKHVEERDGLAHTEENMEPCAHCLLKLCDFGFGAQQDLGNAILAPNVELGELLGAASYSLLRVRSDPNESVSLYDLARTRPSRRWA